MLTLNRKKLSSTWYDTDSSEVETHLGLSFCWNHSNCCSHFLSSLLFFSALVIWWVLFSKKKWKPTESEWRKRMWRVSIERQFVTFVAKILKVKLQEAHILDCWVWRHIAKKTHIHAPRSQIVYISLIIKSFGPLFSVKSKHIVGSTHTHKNFISIILHFTLRLGIATHSSFRSQNVPTEYLLGSAYNVIRSIWSVFFHIFHFLRNRHNSPRKNVISLAFCVWFISNIPKNGINGKQCSRCQNMWRKSKRGKNNQIGATSTLEFVIQSQVRIGFEFFFGFCIDKSSDKQ